MDYCRVVGPRGLCRPLDEKQGFPTNTSPLAPCEDCSKACKERLFEFQGRRQGRLVQKPEGGAGLGTWRGRPLEQAQEARFPETALHVRFWPLFGGVAPSDRRRKPQVPGFCQPGQTPWRGGPSDRRGSPGFCQPEAPDPPGGTPQTPQDRPKTHQW